MINQISPVLVRFPVLSQDFTTMQRAVARASARRDRGSERQQRTTSSTARLRFLNNNVDSLTGTVAGKATFANSRPPAVAWRARVPDDPAASPARRHRRAERSGPHRPAGQLRLRRRREEHRADATGRSGSRSRDLTVVRRGVCRRRTRRRRRTVALIRDPRRDRWNRLWPATLGRHLDSSAQSPESVGGEVTQGRRRRTSPKRRPR